MKSMNIKNVIRLVAGSGIPDPDEILALGFSIPIIKAIEATKNSKVNLEDLFSLLRVPLGQRNFVRNQVRSVM